MKSTAYIVAFIDTTATPPVVVGTGIYSEEHPTSELRKAFPVCVYKVPGASYAEARDEALIILNDPYHAWLKKGLKQ